MSLIKINSMRAEQSLELFLERLVSMMFFLIANVFSHALNLRFAYWESPESSLPSKSPPRFAASPSLMNPTSTCSEIRRQRLSDAIWREHEHDRLSH
jgi:hypothetical protein